MNQVELEAYADKTFREWLHDASVSEIKRELEKAKCAIKEYEAKDDFVHVERFTRQLKEAEEYLKTI